MTERHATQNLDNELTQVFREKRRGPLIIALTGRAFVENWTNSQFHAYRSAELELSPRTLSFATTISTTTLMNGFLFCLLIFGLLFTIAWIREIQEKRAKEGDRAIRELWLQVCAERCLRRKLEREKKAEPEYVKWYREAAIGGDSVAQFRLGLCYYFGHGVPNNYQQAVRWYQRAGDQGNSDALYSLASCYVRGHGAPIDHQQARALFRKITTDFVVEGDGYTQAWNGYFACDLLEKDKSASKSGALEGETWITKKWDRVLYDIERVEKADLAKLKNSAQEELAWQEKEWAALELKWFQKAHALIFGSTNSSESQRSKRPLYQGDYKKAFELGLTQTEPPAFLLCDLPTAEARGILKARSSVRNAGRQVCSAQSDLRRYISPHWIYKAQAKLEKAEEAEKRALKHLAHLEKQATEWQIEFTTLYAKVDVLIANRAAQLFAERADRQVEWHYEWDRYRSDRRKRHTEWETEQKALANSRAVQVKVTNDVPPIALGVMPDFPLEPYVHPESSEDTNGSEADEVASGQGANEATFYKTDLDGAEETEPVIGGERIEEVTSLPATDMLETAPEPEFSPRVAESPVPEPIGELELSPPTVPPELSPPVAPPKLIPPAAELPEGFPADEPKLSQPDIPSPSRRKPGPKRKLPPSVEAPPESLPAPKSEPVTDEFSTTSEGLEGARSLVMSYAFVRDRRLREAAIAIHGSNCCACGLNFDQLYGEDLARGYIEVHHLKPIGQGERKTNARTDLAPLCGNCHAMADRLWQVGLFPPQTMQELVEALQRRMGRVINDKLEAQNEAVETDKSEVKSKAQEAHQDVPAEDQSRPLDPLEEERRNYLDTVRKSRHPITLRDAIAKLANNIDSGDARLELYRVAIVTQTPEVAQAIVKMTAKFARKA